LPERSRTQSTSNCLCTLVRKADRSLTRIYDNALRPSGLVTTQFSLMRTVQRLDESASVNVVARTMRMDRTTVSRNLQPLVRDGLLILSAGKDKRSRLLTLTERGTTVLSETVPLWESIQDQVTDLIGSTHRIEIEFSLTDMIKRLDAIVTDES
jgi:DNA-binding MarR family transcriptional regulator